MLQINRITTIIAIVFIGIIAGEKDSLRTEWMFENSFEKEYLRFNEAVAVVPEELVAALEFYQKGSYRRAADVLYQVRRLNLPDDNLDFIAFLLAECYRKLDLSAKAAEEYRFVASKFPSTDKRPPALFRMLEYMVQEGNIEAADGIRALFAEKMFNHPLYNSVLYSCGKLYFDQERFDEAARILKDVAPFSRRHIQATFLTALCHVQLHDWDKALLLLDYVVRHAENIDMSTEALIVLGDIHYKNNRIEKALSFYQKVPERATRYEYACVKIARCLLDKGMYERAVGVTKSFLDKRPMSEYFFEMASMLEQAFANIGKEKEASEVGERIHKQIISARITFELYDEMDRLTDIIKQWQIRENSALATADTSEMIRSINGRKKGEKLRQKVQMLLRSTSGSSADGTSGRTPHLAERRYLALIKKRMVRMSDSMATLKTMIDKEGKNDTTAIKMVHGSAKTDSLQQLLDKRESEYNDVVHEHELIITECLGGNPEEKRISEEMQVKFIDWEFMKYLEKKEKLVDLIKKMNENADKDTSKTSVIANNDSLAQDTARVKQAILEERERLVNHMETMLDIFPKSRYAPATMFRLAELLVDRGGERYQKKMEKYEKLLIENKDSSAIPFPEYELNEALRTYEKIYNQFSHDRFADNAIYYASLALRKQGMEDSAQAMLLRLIDHYPQSEFYVEANMNIGRYYFEHAKEYKNSYKLAEESFRKVLFYRDHPQFVQALYHLGWCYYMQDRYDEAIAAFKYMIEEVDLEFDPFAKDEKDVANPLLRSEAIDYLAISFDQDSTGEQARDFFKLIGNDDYAALVMNRMGELCEEDLDFRRAIKTYHQLIEFYPISLSAPEASVRLVKLFKSANDTASANRECDLFIKRYGAQSDWQKRVLKHDSALIVKIDSMVIAIGLSVADNTYREAERTGSYESYRSAAEHYRRIVEMYPKHPGAADAAWNLAALLDDKLGDKPAAYERFVSLSHYPGIDSTKRENAALTAIAIAQSLLPADSLAQKGVVDFASQKLIAAVNNYTETFLQGSSRAKVLFTMAGVYFNRKLYGKAAAIYQQILDGKVPPELHYEALLLLGQCHFGEEQWVVAAEIFQKVYKGVVSDEVKTKAYTFLLQALFFNAKVLFDSTRYEQAATAFTSINERYPGSAYGDVALFNAAEAYEKTEQWIKATDRYFDLVKGYPQSKLASDALFNAAGDFEKSEKYTKAAETYETLIAQYPNSDKSKDALFNLGFCYEKLGKLDEMTVANERYSNLYPEEKDVEALLLRSANYYAKTGMLDKAITLYKNFIRRFPQSNKAVEAYYQIGKCQYDQGDKPNALLSFYQAEQHNTRIVESGGTTNAYYASESALYHGLILQDQFNEIRLRPLESVSKQLLKEKTERLSAAVNDFQRVMQYKSEKMFEAGFRMGELYESLANALAAQEREISDPIKAALAENDALVAAAQVLQNAFLPFKTNLAIAKGLDSITSSQREWVQKSKNHLSADLFLAGAYFYDGVGAIQKAPIPKEIQELPLLNFQYKIKLLETLEPLKKRVQDYYLSVLDSLPALHLDDSLTIVGEIHVARLTYLIGSSYDKLAAEILGSTKDLPKNLSDSEKEDLLFQLEDIVYEMQDKALLQLEDAKKLFVARRLEKSDWYGKIMASLARLNPDKYGKSFFTAVNYSTDTTWICRIDSAANWNGLNIPPDGWRAAKMIPASAYPGQIHPDGAAFIGSDTASGRIFVWKNAFFNGVPRSARIRVNVPGKYRLYINGVLTMSDTTGAVDKLTYDSLGSIETLLHGGDNSFACDVQSNGVQAVVAVRINAMIDTSEHFISLVKMPQATLLNSTVATGPTTAVSDSADPKKTDENKKAIGLSKKQITEEIEKFRERERTALSEIRRERLEIQKLRIIKAHRASQNGSSLNSIPASADSTKVLTPAK